MQLRRLQIENFRGITSLDLRLKNTTVLIGENNTGKTAVLDALRFALREVRTRRGCAFEEYDFHLPTANPEPSTAPPTAFKLTFQEDKPEQLDGRTESEVLFKMPESNIEEHLCRNGFQDIYWNLLGEQPRKKVTVGPDDPEYPFQIARALPDKLKTRAAQEVLTAIQNDPTLVPQLFQDVIDAALKLVKVI